MSTRTSNANAYIVSATLHAAVVGLIALFAFESQRTTPFPQKVMELVAGDGNNYGATVAPALGVPDGIKVTIPSAPVPIVKSTPPPEAAATPPPEAVQPAPLTPATPVPPTTAPKHVTKAPPKTITKTATTKVPDPSHDFAKDVKRISEKREKRLMDAYQKQQALPPSAPSSPARPRRPGISTPKESSPACSEDRPTTRRAAPTGRP